MQYTVSLKENRQFRRLYAKGNSAVSPALVIYCRQNGSRGNRLGITVSAKLGNAVVRNKLRRRIKEIYRVNEGCFHKGYDIVVVGRVRGVHCSFSQLQRNFFKAAKGCGILREGQGRP